MPSLLLLFVFPFIATLLMWALQFLSAKVLKKIAFVFSLIPLIFLVLGNHNWLGSAFQYSWFAPIGVNFHLSIDSLSLIFLLLTTLIVPISILSVKSEELNYPATFFGLIFLLEGLLFGFFTARDLVFFTFFWEAMLIPLYFMINIWGGKERRTASLKFLIYMIAGSVLMILAVLALYASTNTFDMNYLMASRAPYAGVLFAIFLLAFAVKTPLFPFHAWLPDTYYEASTAGTILLSALLSKAGIYGIARIGFEIFPAELQEWSTLLLTLAIIGVFYAGLAAWMQRDFKRLIAYSSLAHVNFILAGLFIWNETAHTGAILQAFNHGITIAALFLVSGWLAERLGNTSIGKVSGLAQFLPHLAWLTLFFILSSVALPGTNTFIGELFILFGLFMKNPWFAAILALSVILSVMYMLRFMQKVYFEEPSLFQDRWNDIRGQELAIALPLIVIILWIGIYPSPILKQIEPAASKMKESS